MPKTFSEILARTNLPDTTPYIRDHNFIDVQKLEISKVLSNDDFDHEKVDFAGDAWLAISYKWKVVNVFSVADRWNWKIFVLQIQWVKSRRDWYRLTKWFDFVKYYADCVKQTMWISDWINQVDAESIFETTDLQNIERVAKRYSRFLSLVREG